jgi:hypothetical protein
MNSGCGHSDQWINRAIRRWREDVGDAPPSIRAVNRTWSEKSKPSSPSPLKTFFFPDRGGKYFAIIPARGPYTVIVSSWGVEAYNLMTPGSTLRESEIIFMFDEDGFLISYEGKQFRRIAKPFDGKIDETVALVGLVAEASAFGLRWRTHQIAKGRLR